MAFSFETWFDRPFSRVFQRKNSIRSYYSYAVEESAQSEAINCMIAWIDDKQQVSQHKPKKRKENPALQQDSTSIFQAFDLYFCFAFFIYFQNA